MQKLHKKKSYLLLSNFEGGGVYVGRNTSGQSEQSEPGGPGWLLRAWSVKELHLASRWQGSTANGLMLALADPMEST